MNRTLLPLLALFAGAAPAATLDIEVSGTTPAEGRVMVAVYDHAERWMKKTVRSAVATPGADGKTLLRIENLPDGDYALSLMHDRNGNGKLDANAFGMPIEPYGFSNNASGSFGPPKFEDARFTVKGDTVQRIKLL